jgi:TPR repeat protein
MRLRFLVGCWLLSIAVPCVAAPACSVPVFFDRPASTSIDFSRLLQAAKAGNPSAQFKTGLAYETGAGTEPDYQEAVHWYERSANSGDPAAQNNLGSLYARGVGVPHDDVEAMKWYRRAASAGHPAAANNVGSMYASGRGVPQSDDEAVSWYRKAAAKGYAPAETNLAMMYSSGRGLPKDNQNYPPQLVRFLPKDDPATAPNDRDVIGSGDVQV